MNNKYIELFKSLVDSYYNDTFDSFVYHILSDEEVDKKELSKVISSLCGVSVEFKDTETYISELKKAISNYKCTDNIVEKIKECDSSCHSNEGETPCQKSCPFDAILVDKNTKTSHIQKDLCTDCGNCITSCPSGSILDKIEFMPLLNLFKNNETVIAAVAPAIAGQFGENVSLEMLRTAFKKVGFADMVEVAFFADMLTIKEAFEFNELVNSKDDLMITSCCCPMWVSMIRKIYKDLARHVSPSVSPMIASGRVIKKLNPNCKVVFIGPCIAKKAESRSQDISDAIDFVLTFEELKGIFDVLDIDPEKLPETHTKSYASREGRLYGRTGGVSTSVDEAVKRIFPNKHHLFKSTKVDGVKDCKDILNKTQAGNIGANFLEGMGCVGGCVGGPKAIVHKDQGRESVNKTAESSEIKISVDSERMKDILSRIGINSIEDFGDKSKVDIFERRF
ncbi:iron only hydrogenase large subunit-like protein [Clostridium acetobutylicum]|uniref:Hydrogenase subunit (Ferredoxin) n=1 Tax=Clostridium acetobutylicum (strain ATCC 824 / DSM 792 / JCM 1419 / IAM 19013 / LMG 5710 / NBRC 13948 / NRRL B-527 / VKM B-1787 / 2291 / W) TaxID=272562 RepID=Q97E85_CLOAB|nr:MULTISPECIES: [Fe-Fe] hydrogenase large subunit C-terminal domain-containing protein [Clostridium]AAK81165.1 Hydrogenase subunit (ferredoxin) [Clostridium acetobutylicum ATCC 824]ADZ22270.1 Hydrogenase subunit (ferredoxin) [Clostridium acetobutylicum EA 2018]AEI33623.1 hydrogenase subunit (ferredoxin) [Clostridium acetobutylicum DSM 1731]AWV81167.1 iron hydrogenase [Clostridium acetobutylicum]MBC2395631.1 4Fe-4S binding protein [Clostridium acetobutylicum]